MKKDCNHNSQLSIPIDIKNNNLKNVNHSLLFFLKVQKLIYLNKQGQLLILI